MLRSPALQLHCEGGTRFEAWHSEALELADQGTDADRSKSRYWDMYDYEIQKRTFRHAGPEILMIAIADLPGAVERAKIVGSS